MKSNKPESLIKVWEATITSSPTLLYLTIIFSSFPVLGTELWDCGIWEHAKQLVISLATLRKFSQLPFHLTTDKSFQLVLTEESNFGTPLPIANSQVKPTTTQIGSAASDTLHHSKLNPRCNSNPTLLLLDGMVVSKSGTPISKSDIPLSLMKETSTLCLSVLTESISLLEVKTKC